MRGHSLCRICCLKLNNLSVESVAWTSLLPGHSLCRICCTEACEIMETRANPNNPFSRTALLLIDFQKAFTTGSWAQRFGGESQLQDIARACKEVAKLLDGTEGAARMIPSNIPILSTRCYLDGEHDAPFVEGLEVLLEHPCLHKPGTDVTQNSAFEPWLLERVEEGLEVLVVGGCTTTSCVRVSSQAVVRLLETSSPARGSSPAREPVPRVVVDLTLCGARAENFEKNAAEDPVLVRTYGRDVCVGRSARDLAILQMRQAGVEVLEEGYEWKLC